MGRRAITGDRPANSKVRSLMSSKGYALLILALVAAAAINALFVLLDMIANA